jgi:hypothetical protein
VISICSKGPGQADLLDRVIHILIETVVLITSLLAPLYEKPSQQTPYLPLHKAGIISNLG